MKYSPIALFLYKRPEHTKKTLDALAKNSEAIDSELFIYCDGLTPNSGESDREKVNVVRKIAGEENRFKKVNLIFREENLGLANSIISGVSEIINLYGRIIVLEDDIVPSMGFLKYMNEALDLYQYDDKVGCIHAWNYDLDKTKFEHSTFFLRGGDCWGWATWKESWKLFNPNGKDLLYKIKSDKLQYSFNRNGTHSFVEMLEDQIIGKNDSWAIRWHASLFLNDCYCLHPVKPLVLNIGLDGSGTHCGYHEFEQNFENHLIELNKIDIKESAAFHNAFKSYQLLQIRTNKWTILRNFLKKLHLQFSLIFSIIS